MSKSVIRMLALILILFTLTTLYAEDEPQYITFLGKLTADQYTVTRPEDRVGDDFAFATDISGTWAVAGQPNFFNGDGSTGRVFVYRLIESAWQEAQLITPPMNTASLFGYSLAIHGDHLIIGSPGEYNRPSAAYIYHLNGSGHWELQQQIIASDGVLNDRFGRAVAIYGDYAAIGAPYATSNGKTAAGAAYLFALNNGTWVEEIKLVAADATTNTRFGYNLAINLSGGLIRTVVGTVSRAHGIGYVYRLDPDTGWTLEQKLVSNPTAANTYSDYGGRMIAMSGDILAIGTPAARSAVGNTAIGGVHLYSLENNAWTLDFSVLSDDTNGIDLFGRTVDISGDTLIVGGWDINSNDNRSATGIFIKDGEGNWTRETFLTSDDYHHSDHFYQVSLDGDAAFVGASRASGVVKGTGAGYFFNRNAGIWSQTAKVFNARQYTGTDYNPGASMGVDLALQGDTAIIGVPWDRDRGEQKGAAYVYQRADAGWLPIQKLYASTTNPDAAWFGEEIALDSDGDRAAISATWDARQIHIFDRIHGVWTQTAEIVPPPFAGRSMFRMILSGNTLIVGVPETITLPFYENVGLVYIYEFDGSTWTPKQTITLGNSAEALFGSSLALHGDTLVIGAQYHAYYTGAAYIYKRMEGTWQQQQKLMADDAQMDHFFGASLAFDGTTILVSAPGYAANQGKVYGYTFDGAQWVQTSTIPNPDPANLQQMGYAVDFSGSTALIMAQRGVFLFEQMNGGWQLRDSSFPVENESSDRYGVRLAVDDGTMLVSAPEQDVNGLVDAGTVYVYDIPAGRPSDFSLTSPQDDTLLRGGARLEQFTWSASQDAVTYQLTALKISGNHGRLGQVLSRDVPASSCVNEVCSYTLMQEEQAAFDSGTFTWTVIASGIGQTEASNGAYEFRIANDPLELVINGGFEAKNQRWVMSKPKDAYDRVICNKPAQNKVYAYSGKCAFRLVGGQGKNNQIRQTIDLTGITLNPGDALNFSLWADATTAVQGARAQLIVRYTDSSISGDVVTLPMVASTGYHSITNETPLILKGIVKTIQVKIIYAGKAGRVLIDDVSVTVSGNSPLIDGFRGIQSGVGTESESGTELIPVPMVTDTD